MPRNPLSVKLHFSCVPPLKCSSVYPHKNRQLLICAFCTCPYIQIKAVFAYRYIGINMEFPAINIISDSGLILHGYRTEFIAVSDSIPVFARLRSPPPVISHRRCCEGNSPKHSYPRVIRRKTFHLAVFCNCGSDHYYLLVKRDGSFALFVLNIARVSRAAPATDTIDPITSIALTPM